MSDTLPKDFKPKKSGVNKTGIALAIGITAVALFVAIGFTGITPIFEIPVMQQEPSTTLAAPQSSVVSGSYASSAGDLTDQLDFRVSGGDVKSMLANEQDDTLVITIDTYDDGELFVDLDAQFIGSFNDGTYFVIIDNEEFNDYEQAGTELYIPFEFGTEKIEIVGSYTLS